MTQTSARTSAASGASSGICTCPRHGGRTCWLVFIAVSRYAQSCNRRAAILVPVSSRKIMTILLASIGETLRNEFALAPGEADILASSIVRLFVAMMLGGVLGLEREW